MVLKNKKIKKCCSACDPAREVKREWNSCTAQKRKRMKCLRRPKGERSEVKWH
jgi:hypothetical protein